MGLIREEFGNWTAKLNREIAELVSEPNIIEEIKSARLYWIEHRERIGEDQVA